MERAGQTIGERTAELQKSQAILKRLVDSAPAMRMSAEEPLRVRA
jgi:hypothetical protein